MELEQILKKMEWLDDERRKDKNVIATLQERLQVLEGSLDVSQKQVKELSTEIARLNAVTNRIDQFDEALLQQRVEAKRRDEEIEKAYRKSQEEAEKVRRVEMRALETSIADVRKGLEPIADLRRSISGRVDDVLRIDRTIEELRQRIEELRHTSEEFVRTYRLVEEGRRQDAKRVAEFQGEVSAVRKRSDEQRAQQELVANNLRKLEARITDLSTVEVERREAQAAFLEQQTLWQVERDRTWKDWVGRLEVIEKLALESQDNIQYIDATHQMVKRSQESLESLAERVERRINEITEIQRLAEERFRQEWVTFKADDQKRWTNYTLSQDEQRTEINRQQEKITAQIASLEDSLQEAQDLLRQVSDQTEKRLQSLLALAHEWVSNYERILGQIR